MPRKPLPSSRSFCLPQRPPATRRIVRFELRAGGAFAVAKLGDALGAGPGFEATVGYRSSPISQVYAGWDWHQFTADASFAGSKDDFEECGYVAGLQSAPDRDRGLGVAAAGRRHLQCTSKLKTPLVIGWPTPSTDWRGRPAWRFASAIAGS